MSKNGYAILRTSTLAWLLEQSKSKVGEAPHQVLSEIAELVENPKVEPPPDLELELRGSGPLLTVEEHVSLLEDADLGLPTDRHGGSFWRLVVKVCHEMLVNEAEAARRISADGG